MKSTVLKDLLENYGPEAVCRSGWAQCAWKLLLHLVGGEDDVIRTETMQKRIGIDAILKETIILAVTGEFFYQMHLPSYHFAELVNQGYRYSQKFEKITYFIC